MKISEAIKKLQEAMEMYGDHPMTTFDGFIQTIKLTPAKNGVVYPLPKNEQNEIGIEIINKWQP